MKFMLLSIIMLLGLSSLIIPQNMNTSPRASFSKVHLPLFQKQLLNIQSKDERSALLRKELISQKNRLYKDKNTVIYRPVKLTKNSKDSVTYLKEIITYTYNNSGKCLTELKKIVKNGINRENYSRYTFTYDSFDNCTQELDELWSGNAWVNDWRYTNAYDNSGNNISELEERWTENGWENESRYTTTYDNNGGWLTDQLEVWQNGVWENDSRYIAERNDKGDLLSEITEVWMDSSFVTLYKTSYLYDNYGNIILENNEVWKDETWKGYYRFSDTFDESGKWLTDLVEVFNDSTNSWKIIDRYTATYGSSSNLLVNLGEEYSDGVWENFSKRIYTYDNNNNAVHGESYVWHNGTWILSWGALDLFYDNLNRSISSYSLDADVEYTAITVSGVNSNQLTTASYSLEQNYPNPFNPTTKISYSVPTESFITLKVYDILGNEIAILLNEKKNKGDYNVEFNAAHLSCGVYFYQIISGGFVQTRKMILLK